TLLLIPATLSSPPISLFFLLIPRPPRPTLFPYTTLFRSKGITWKWYSGGYADAAAGQVPQRFEFHHQPMAFFADLAPGTPGQARSEEHTSELQSRGHLVCRLLLEKKNARRDAELGVEAMG